MNGRGIPFAAPPVGSLRFQKPSPALPHDGMLDCTSYGDRAVCVQIPDEAEPIPTGEDSLFVNVFAPIYRDLDSGTARPLSGAKLPTLVWVHGGGFVGGSGVSELVRRH